MTSIGLQPSSCLKFPNRMTRATRCITESARPHHAVAAILRIVCGNFLKLVGGKVWKSSVIGLEFFTSILIGFNYVNNAAAPISSMISWKTMCACCLSYPKEIRNNFSSLPIYLFTGQEPNYHHLFLRGFRTWLEFDSSLVSGWLSINFLIWYF